METTVRFVGYRIAAKFSSHCRKCGGWIKAGRPCYYLPGEGVLCARCPSAEEERYAQIRAVQPAAVTPSFQACSFCGRQLRWNSRTRGSWCERCDD